jgi:hypothetical protein
VTVEQAGVGDPTIELGSIDLQVADPSLDPVSRLVVVGGLGLRQLGALEVETLIEVPSLEA